MKAGLGWNKVLELPYRIDFGLKGQRHPSSVGLIVLQANDREINRFSQKTIFFDDWTVSLRKYDSGFGQRYTDLDNFDSKEKALKFALDYMNKHPHGAGL